MHDVARLAGVSQSTVSRVLNETESSIPISEETRQRIFEAVEKLEYQPNMIARSLRTQRSQMIAVMIGDISNAFYHPIVRAVQDVAGARDYDVLISNSDHIYENEARFLRTVLRRPVDGVIMAPHRLTTKDLDRFVKRSLFTPIVAIGAQVEHPMIDVIGGTSDPATYDAISWLIKSAGHRRIGFIGPAGDMPPGPPRLHGYTRALVDADLHVDQTLIHKAEFTIDGGYHAMIELLQAGNLPTAVFACNSLMAMGAIRAARDQGYQVPYDISVMGFDDIPEALLIQPALTVVSRDLTAIGKQAAELLFERIVGNVTEPGRFFQSTWSLIERESVRILSP